MGENTYRVVVGKDEGKSPLGRSNSKWQGNNNNNKVRTDWPYFEVIDPVQDNNK
jgi:hypothetical protein